MSAPALRTPLHALHVALGARMVPFAGWDMPVQYPSGILAEHAHTRTACALFDVSHMGQLALAAEERVAALERLVPGDIAGLVPGRMRYTMLTNDRGGIVDDLMVTNQGERLFLVVNAARRDADLAHLRAHLPANCPLAELDDRALLALQGPSAAAVIARHAPGAAALPFLASGGFAIGGMPVVVSRSGYTGEDGFEISVPASEADRIARVFLGEKEVAPAGLGARDTLRLEAGLCLYGHDIDETTTPIEAGLGWTIARRRRQGGGYPGAAVIARQLAEGAPRRRVGIALDGRVPARDGNAIVDPSGRPIGAVTSGGYGPTVGAPIAMGYVEAAHAAPGAPVAVVVRDAARPGRVVPLPFVPHRYARST
jgi:aminomethyltransferase